ncbi:hypothetical protein [Deinococcus aestuarii]|uniref:hypothetical protein n=1 Tax=Deinococcus aestuarii TaxID=2774531 RepID=UPI001C0BBD83|nr:hypothetical protein [Deinococcus aestuarii]
MFGPRLGFGAVKEGDREIVLLWDGQVDSVVGLAEGGPENVAWQLLSTAQDLWLRGLGEEGTHPGVWATASPEVSRDGLEWVLALRGPGGEVASARVPPVEG